MKSTESEISKQLHELQKSGLTEDEIVNDDDSQFAFLFLEKELDARSLKSIDQLPIKGNDIIQLVNSIPANPLVFAVMQKIQMTECLQFPLASSSLDRNNVRIQGKSPVSPYLTGTGFHSTMDRSTGYQNVFDVGNVCYPSVIGFALPTQMTCQRVGKIFNVFKVFQRQDAYTAYRQNELKLPSGLQFKGSPRTGFNVSHHKSYADIAFTYVREYRLFSLTMKPTADLNPVFVTRVKNICTYSVEEFFGLKQWEELFSTHGTHVVHSANGGGKVVITILENQLKNYFKTEQLYKKEKEIEELLSNYLDCVDGENESAFDNLLISSIKLHGGDIGFEHVDLAKCKNRKEVRSVLQEWIETLPLRPLMSDTDLVLESIPDIMTRKGLSTEAETLNSAAKKIWGKSFKTVLSNKLSADDQKVTRWSFW